MAGVRVMSDKLIRRIIASCEGPFKEAADKWPSDVEDAMKIACCSDITVGDLRRARAALKGIEHE